MHTPAPWVKRGLGIYVNDETFTTIIGVVHSKEAFFPHSLSVSLEEAQANAHLIANAPDLLKALEEIATTTHYDGSIMASTALSMKDIAEQAIAKAKGE